MDFESAIGPLGEAATGAGAVGAACLAVLGIALAFRMARRAFS